MEWLDTLNRGSTYVIPLVAGTAGGLLLFGKRNYFDAFVRGAREGLRTAVRLCPTLLLLLSAIGMLRASGALGTICGWLAPAADAIGLPAELLPLLLTRPFSGSAAMATYSQLLETCGADSFPAACASVIMGSSDTVIYVVSIYFSSVGVKRGRYALPVALAVMLFGIFFSCFLCRVCLR